jgi:DNA-directed RNA polymerase specialized sigma24 family protein
VHDGTADGSEPVNRADEDDFRSFVAARSPSVLWFAYLLTGDRHAAEDIVQTALAKTAAGWSRVRRKENPEGYVRRAIVNTHLNAVRRRPWREQPHENPPEGVDSRRREHELDDRDAMWHALSGLPPRSDIADVLGCSRGTVKSQAAKGLLHLRRIVQKEDAST